MKSERWAKVESVYRAALRREPAERRVFLTEACAGDEELLREVESLLEYDQQAKSFLEAPALEVEARSMAADGGLSLAGQRLAHYNITEKIGAGGMGEVYRARDTKLKRDVAIKILPNEFSRDRVPLGEVAARSAWSRKADNCPCAGMTVVPLPKFRPCESVKKNESTAGSLFAFAIATPVLTGLATSA
jgi:serine/threonine protein kinase